MDGTPDESAELEKKRLKRLRAQRERVRNKTGIRHLYRSLIFAAGFFFIALGIGLSVLPGPFTIPPVRIGLWILSTEFTWAERFFDRFQDKARVAWVHAKARPVPSAITAVFGIASAGVAIWAVKHYDLIDKAKDAVGLS